MLSSTSASLTASCRHRCSHINFSPTASLHGSFGLGISTKSSSDLPDSRNCSSK
ncbi:hypothetical protein MKW98_015679, partial [Papaver atlanticum]